MRQLELFFIALAYFTRLPIPGWVAFAPEKLGQAARCLPLVGWVVAAIGAAVFWLASGIFEMAKLFNLKFWLYL